jgi:hypothetical protein
MTLNAKANFILAPEDLMPYAIGDDVAVREDGPRYKKGCAVPSR